MAYATGTRRSHILTDVVCQGDRQTFATYRKARHRVLFCM